MHNKKPITIMTAPSCAGKDYLSKCLFQQFPGLFEMAVSCTTRPPRQGEIDGKDYNFLTLDQFEEMESNNRLLESVRFGDKCYGTSANEIERIQKAGKFPVLIVEPIGAINIWNWCSKNEQAAQFAFIDVDREVALSRFLDRYVEDYKALVDDSCSDKDFAIAFNDLVSNYTKRIYISMYEESHWSKMLPYNSRLGQMKQPNDSVEAAKRVMQIAARLEEKPTVGIPDHILSVPKSSSSPKNSALHDMNSVIKKSLVTINTQLMNSESLKGIILKSESERLNQITFNI